MRLIYGPIIVFVKISILLQYVTLFVARRRNAFHYTVHILVWIFVIFYTVITFTFIFQCTPRHKQWNPTVPGRCQDRRQTGVFSGSINVVSDLLILLLPLPVIWRLRMTRNKKFRLLGVFGFGSFACVASIVRLFYTIKANNTTPGSTAYQMEVNKQGLWAMAEVEIGIIVGCIPTLPKFFKHFSSKIPAMPFHFGLRSSNSSWTSWRRLFRKPTTSGTSSNKPTLFPPQFFGTKASRSRAPHIGTLDLTRASFSYAEKDLPSMLLPVHNKDSLSSKSTSSTQPGNEAQTWYIEGPTPVTEVTAMELGEGGIRAPAPSR